jgi:diguanylate cyclase (GGDEF)-like protein
MQQDAQPQQARSNIPPDAFRILVIDGNGDARQLLTNALIEKGCNVRSAESGSAALPVLMRESFDVCVIDLGIQEMDALVFLQEALRISPWIGMVAVSASVGDAEAVKASSLGVARILSKPVSAMLVTENVMAEAQERRQMVEGMPHINSLSMLHDHLKILTRIGHRTLGMGGLLGALQDFGKELAPIMPSDVLGILVLDHEERALRLTSHHPLDPHFIEEVKDEMFTRYSALCGLPLDRATVEMHAQGAECADGGALSVGTVLSVPVLVGNEIRGLLTLASREKEAYTAADISLLYYAANYVSELFSTMRHMHHLATQDPLTGAFNRIRLEDELQRTWLMSHRYGFSMAVIVVDLDHFKTLNDSYGHAAGDDVLRDFAQVMRSVARESDIVARYGGDEFVAILPRAEEKDAAIFGERFASALRQHVFCSGSLRLSLTASIGVATSLNRTAPATSDELLRQADRALFMAKRAGRNRICVWPAQSRPESAPPPGDPGSQLTGSLVPVERRGADCVVVVDDEPNIRELVRMMLTKDGFEVSAHGDASTALEFIRNNPGRCDVLLTDLALPGKSGLDLLHEITPLDDSIIKLVMTGYATVDAAVNSLREGAYDFIQKPVRHAHLTALLRRAVEYRHLRLDNARYQLHLEDMVRQRSDQLAQSLEEVKRSYQFTLESMIGLLDARESQTGRHSSRARDLTVLLAQKMGVVGKELEAIAHGAFLHDIGKIGIPDSILLKPGPLTPEERAIMRTHSEIGYRIMHNSPQLQHAAQIIRTHHESFDGGGYPDGLKGDEITLGARIFAVIDAYDSMRSDRVYRRPQSLEQTVAEIVKYSGVQFDPNVVKAFQQCIPDLERILARQNVAPEKAI